jgi:hypothetical protein
MTTNPSSALWLPLFDELADPLVVARLAAEAEDVGRDGFSAWDHLTWAAPVGRVTDPWTSLAAAAATESLRLARRRPARLAREAAEVAFS